MNRQTTLLNSQDAPAQWWVVDAADQVLGRLSVKLARVLMGKHRPTYTPHCPSGDFVVVINADKIRLTGSKADLKVFQRYTGYPGGQKRFSYRWMLENDQETLLERSVRRMMPRNKLRAHRIARMKVYKGTEHPHQAQRPQPLP